MRILIIILFVLIGSHLKAQKLPSNEEYRESINLTSWNNELNLNSARYLRHGKHIILIQSIDNNHQIQWEIIKTDSNQYQYNEYQFVLDSGLIKPRFRKKGYLILSDESQHIDTFITLDVETFEEILIIQKERKLKKHGIWMEKIGNLYFYGNYKNGQKDGKWYYEDIGNALGKLYEITYKNGTEISRWNKNVTLSPNRDTLQEYITGYWHLSMRSLSQPDRNLLFLNKKQGSRHYIFKKNGEYITIHTCGVSRKQPITRWYISNENHLIINGQDVNKKYKIRKLTPSELVLERIY